MIPVAVDKPPRDGRRGSSAGQKNDDDAAHKKIPRPIIIQFATRSVRNDVWKKSEDAKN